MYLSRGLPARFSDQAYPLSLSLITFILATLTADNSPLFCFPSSGIAKSTVPAAGARFAPVPWFAPAAGARSCAGRVRRMFTIPVQCSCAPSQKCFILGAYFRPFFPKFTGAQAISGQRSR